MCERVGCVDLLTLVSDGVSIEHANGILTRNLSKVIIYLFCFAGSSQNAQRITHLPQSIQVLSEEAANELLHFPRPQATHDTDEEAPKTAE